MTDEEHLAVEAAQFVQHVHDIADLFAKRMASLPAVEAEALLDHASFPASLYARSSSKQLAARRRLRRGWVQSSAVIRTRVEELLKRG